MALSYFFVNRAMNSTASGEGRGDDGSTRMLTSLGGQQDILPDLRGSSPPASQGGIGSITDPPTFLNVRLVCISLNLLRLVLVKQSITHPCERGTLATRRSHALFAVLFLPIQYNRIVATKTLYVCSNCGHQAPKWLGRCPDCGEWSTFVEEVREAKKVVGFAERATRQKAKGRGEDAGPERGARRRGRGQDGRRGRGAQPGPGRWDRARLHGPRRRGTWRREEHAPLAGDGASG